jgi:hypothetical protein
MVTRGTATMGGCGPGLPMVLPVAREVITGQRLAPGLPGWTERRTMPDVTTFCPVTWCNNPLDGTNLTILICYQTHQMTMVSASLTVLYPE